MDNIIILVKAFAELLFQSDNLFYHAMGQRLEQYLESPDGVDFTEVVSDLRDDTIYWLEDTLESADEPDMYQWMAEALEIAQA